MYIRERKEVVILHSLLNYATKKHLTLPTKNEKFYFIVYMMFFSKNEKFALDKGLTKTKRSYYLQLNESVNKLLTNHIEKSIFAAWMKDVKKV